MILPIVGILLFFGVCLYSVWDAFIPSDNEEPRNEE